MPYCALSPTQPEGLSMTSPPIKVLFVCLGNICRSPTAEGLFRALVDEQRLSGKIVTDSAGTGSWHIGSPPDPRAQQTAIKRGYDISDLRGRQTRSEDFDDFDYILVMDRSNLRNMEALKRNENARAKLQMFLDYVPEKDRQATKGEVPDPYYGGLEDYEFAIGLIEGAANGLLDHIRTTHFTPAAS